MSTQRYTITEARYAKNMMAVHVVGDGSGFKNRAERLASYFARRRYSGREHAYIMSKAAAVKFEQHFLDGWDTDVFGKALQK